MFGNHLGMIQHSSSYISDPESLRPWEPKCSLDLWCICSSARLCFLSMSDDIKLCKCSQVN